MLRREYRFRGARGEFAPDIRGARLEDHWPTLRRTCDIQRTTHREMLALVVKRVQFGGIEVTSRRAIPQESVIVPAIP